jgi:ribosome-associated protein
VIESVLEKKADSVTVLDLREIASFVDYFVICCGESAPQIKTISNHVQDKLSARKIRLHHIEGRPETGWLLLDYSDFIVHIFSPEKRQFFELERLWNDAPRLDTTDKIGMALS